MTYDIKFYPLNINGEVVDSASFTISTTKPLDITGKRMAFERLCVEYARLTGIKCSFAGISEVKEV